MLCKSHSIQLLSGKHVPCAQERLIQIPPILGKHYLDRAYHTQQGSISPGDVHHQMVEGGI